MAEIKYTAEDSLGTQLSIVLRLLCRNIQRDITELGYDVTVWQWLILMFLRLENGQSQAQLAEKCGKEKTNITRIIDAMEEKGLIKRAKDKTDRRRNIISVTDNGARIESKLTPIVVKGHQKALAGFSDEGKRTFFDYLYKIRDNLDGSDE